MIGFLVLGFGLFIWASLAMAKEFNIVNGPLISLSPSPTPITLLGEIQKGIALLKSSPPLDYVTKKMVLKHGQMVKTGDLVRKQIALAILDTNTGEIFQRRIWVSEQDITNYKKTRTITLTPANPAETLDIEANWWNSFNTFYQITGHPELVVIADKYLLASRDLGNLPEKSTSQYSEIVYAPYSEGIHTGELVDAGKEYIGNVASQAFGELNSKNVLSISVPGALVTKGISEDFIKNIILIEHIDPDSFNMADDGGKGLAERTLALIGANQKLAYRYTGSSAGASGLAQFIKSTYISVVATYPRAGLLKDYSLGMADHVNAVKAMVLFFDSHKKSIADNVSRPNILAQIGVTEEMLAASYNGGSSKVIRSINKYGLAWLGNQLASIGNMIFKKETINYIQKLEAIKGLNIF